MLTYLVRNSSAARRYTLATLGGAVATVGLAALLFSLIETPPAVVEASQSIVRGQSVQLVPLPQKKPRRRAIKPKLPPRPAKPLGTPSFAPPLLVNTQVSALPTQLSIERLGVEGSERWKPSLPELGKVVLEPLRTVRPLLGAYSEIAPLVSIEPVYPPTAWVRGISGWVILRYTVTKKGRVTELKVLRSEPPSLFNGSALAAAKKWRYRPRLVDGEAVDVRNVWSKVSFDAATSSGAANLIETVAQP